MPEDRVVYLDNHATTRVDPRVVEAMLPWMTEDYGNASSIGHAYGDAAREAVEEARATIAAAIGAEPIEIVFTSGATESNNLAIRGVAERSRRRGDHLTSVRTEHNAVLEPLHRLSKAGREVTLLGVEPNGSPAAGRFDPQSIAGALTDETCLVSVMLANNEIGVIQPLGEIASVCRERGVLLHSDATQAVGKIPVDVQKLGVDLMSFTAHKLYGPKGVGALYVRRRDPTVRLDPQISGGGQEKARRGGTLNVPGIVGFARAIELCVEELAAEGIRLAALRDRLAEGLLKRIEGSQLAGPPLDAVDDHGERIRLPGNLNLLLPAVDGEAVMLASPGVAMSSGAACSSADPEPSHVLRALGLSDDQSRASLRFGLGRFNTEEDIDLTIRAVGDAVEGLRGMGQS